MRKHAIVLLALTLLLPASTLVQAVASKDGRVLVFVGANYDGHGRLVYRGYVENLQQLIGVLAGYDIDRVKIVFHGESFTDRHFEAKLLAFYPDRKLLDELETLRPKPIDFREAKSLTGFSKGYVEVYFSGEGDSEKKLAILAPDSIVDSKPIRELVGLHRGLGAYVHVFSLSEVGIYRPAEKPPVRLANVTDYNDVLARRIISFARFLVEQGYHYLLIVGDAATIPPSAYYESPTLETLIGDWYAIVPTDFFYADPDYDMKPELAVGRIPFTNVTLLQRYVDTLRSWIAYVGEGHKPRLLFVGGAPFAWTAFFGESVAVQLADLNVTNWVSSIDYFTRLLGNIDKDSVSKAINYGDYTFVFTVVHGDGKSFIDFFPAGVYGSDFEEVYSVEEVSKRKTPVIVLSPACVNAAWDYTLLPPAFKPPSLAAAMLAEGTAIAYLGPTRVDFELISGIGFDDNGLLKVDFSGATLLYATILKAALHSETLGDAWVKALKLYYSLKETHYEVSTPRGWEDLALLNVLQATLLGDPAIPLPKTEARKLEVDISINGARYSVSAKLVFPEEYQMVEGEMPLASLTQQVTIGLSQPAKEVVVCRIYTYATELLIGVEKVFENSHTTSIVIGGDTGGLLRIAAVVGNNYVHLALARAGLAVEGNKLKIVGLDLLKLFGSEPAEVLVNGKLYTIVPGGLTNYTTTLPSTASTIAVKPLTYYQVLAIDPSEAEKLLQPIEKVFTLKLGKSARWHTETIGGKLGFSETIQEHTTTLNILAGLVALLVLVEAIIIVLRRRNPP